MQRRFAFHDQRARLAKNTEPDYFDAVPPRIIIDEPYADAFRGQIQPPMLTVRRTTESTHSD